MAELLTSPRLLSEGFLHGFSLRAGGVSRPPFASLNLGRGVGDDPAAVEENYARFARAVGYPPDSLMEVHQVHGARVRVVGAADRVSAVRKEQADALLARHGQGPVGVRVADCLPLLLADSETGNVAAVHAGWRGTVAGVVGAAVGRMVELGADPRQLLAVIFPHIRACCFEVGEEVAARLAAVSTATEVVHPRAPRPHVSLANVVTAQLVDGGLQVDAISDTGGCTHCEPERFFSFRRDGDSSGRHLAVIVPR